MRISVAMTTYNGALYVEEQLASLAAQSRGADEIVIIDDCSSDNTAEIVSAFVAAHGLSNWHFSVNPQNVGYKQNFKQAIAACTGELIFLCDQDDVWAPDKIARMERVFQTHPDCIALNTSFRYVDQAGAPIPVAPKAGMSNQNLIKRPIAPGALERISIEELVSYNISPGCTMAFRQALRQPYLERTCCGVVHDWELNFLAAALFDGCWFLNEQWMDYRLHGSNAVGIPGVAKGDCVQPGDYQHRLSVAGLMQDYTDCFQVYFDLLRPAQKAVFTRQLAFVRARRAALASKKPSRVLGLYRYRKNYQNSVTWKGRIADLLCLLKVGRDRNGKV